jgi:hypothetical protein
MFGPLEASIAEADRLVKKREAEIEKKGTGIKIRVMSAPRSFASPSESPNKNDGISDSDISRLLERVQ